MGLLYLPPLTLRTLGFPPDILLMGLLCALVQALRLCTGRRGSRGIALLFFDHDTRGQPHAPMVLLNKRYIHFCLSMHAACFFHRVIPYSNIPILRSWTSEALRQTYYWLWDMFYVLDNSIGFDANVFLCKVLSNNFTVYYKDMHDEECVLRWDRCDFHSGGEHSNLGW